MSCTLAWKHYILLAFWPFNMFHHGHPGRSWTFCKHVELLCAKIEQIIEYQTIHLNTKITDDNPNISVFMSALIKHNNTCII